jgi:tRNA-Thr(GGU) m(6)t(6)A37 methyltransferase TsaA
MKMQYSQIGVIHSPFTTPRGTPIQPGAAQGEPGMIEVFQEYAEGLKDLDGFSHILVIYHFHRIRGSSLSVTPFLDDQKHGVFSTRAPNRPNPIGISVVRLVSRERNTLHVKDLDIIDGTPLLDIKPYVPEFDAVEAEKTGWLQKQVKKLPGTTDDGRFTG